VNLGDIVLGLQSYRDRITVAIDALLDLAPIGNGSAPVVALAASALKALPAPRNGKTMRPSVKAKRSAPAKERSAPIVHRGTPNPNRAKARALWDQGKTIAAIAAKVGETVQAIYYWRKADAWPERDVKAESTGPAPRRRCEECGQTSAHKDKCIHCGEPWK